MLFSPHSRRVSASSVAEWQSGQRHSRRGKDPIRAVAPKPSVAAHCRVRRLAFEKIPIIFQKALDKSHNVC